MDSYTAAHLDTWLMHHVAEDEREQVKDCILKVIAEHPHLLNGYSWNEIRDLGAVSL